MLMNRTWEKFTGTGLRPAVVESRLAKFETTGVRSIDAIAVRC